jgi:hypothetical protein
MSIDKKRFVEASDEVPQEEQPDEQEIEKVKKTILCLVSLTR